MELGDRTPDLLNTIQESSRPNTPSLQGVTSIESNACTAACTSEPETDQGAPPYVAGTSTVSRMSCTSNQKVDESDPVAKIAAALIGMSPADRARLAALLMSGESGVKGEATPRDTPDTRLP